MNYDRYFVKKFTRQFDVVPLQQALRYKSKRMVPGYCDDPFDRNQPCRFEKWHKLPDTAWKLFWRTHKVS